MDAFHAETVYCLLMGIAVGTWFWSLRQALHMGKQMPEVMADVSEDPFATFDDLPQQPEDSGSLTGEKTVRGTPEAVSQKLAEALLSTGAPGMFSTLFEIVDRTQERIRIRKTGPLICNQTSGMYFSDAEFHLTPAGEDRVVVSYELGFDRLVRRIRIVSLSLILGLGLPAILITGGIIWYFVVNNQNPSVRWQVFQLLQLVHVIWPPFLVLYFYRAGRRHGRTFVSNVLSILELATAPGEPVR